MVDFWHFATIASEKNRRKPGQTGKNFSACHAASYDVAALGNKSAS
jgi:hypothetical protein